MSSWHAALYVSQPHLLRATFTKPCLETEIARLGHDLIEARCCQMHHNSTLLTVFRLQYHFSG